MDVFSKIVIIVFVISGVILLTGKTLWFPDFYNPDFMGAISFFSAIIIIGIKKILGSPKEPEKKYAQSLLQFVVSLALLFNGAGALGAYKLHEVGFQFDRLVHFVNPLLITIVFSYVFRLFYKKTKAYSLTLSFLIVLAGGIGWEAMEILYDYFFYTQTWGAYGQNPIWDTKMDVMWNFIGSVIGLIIAFYTVDNKRICLGKRSEKGI